MPNLYADTYRVSVFGIETLCCTLTDKITLISNFVTPNGGLNMIDELAYVNFFIIQTIRREGINKSLQNSFRITNFIAFSLQSKRGVNHTENKKRTLREDEDEN